MYDEKKNNSEEINTESSIKFEKFLNKYINKDYVRADTLSNCLSILEYPLQGKAGKKIITN